MYIPMATIKRLPKYLDFFLTKEKEGMVRIKSVEVAEEMEIAGSTVRRDLSFISEGGVRGWGFDVSSMIKSIESIIGKELEANIAIIGVGNMGKAFMKYNKRQRNVAKITAAFDVNEKLIGKSIDSVPVYDIKEMESIVKSHNISIAILSTTTEVAQETFERAKKAGIKAFINFTSHKITNEDKKIHVKTVDIEHMINEMIFKLKIDF